MKEIAMNDGLPPILSILPLHTSHTTPPPLPKPPHPPHQTCSVDTHAILGVLSGKTGASVPEMHDQGGVGEASAELESLVGQILEELVRDALWGLPTQTLNPADANTSTDGQLTPQVSLLISVFGPKHP